MKETIVLSDGRVQLSISTLYGAFKRLLEQGWIERMDDNGGQENGRNRKIYVLTRFGRRILQAEATWMEGLVTAVNRSSAGAQA